MSKKKSWKVLLGVLLLMLVLRAPLFRWCVRYEFVGERSIPPLENEQLLTQLNEELAAAPAGDCWYWAEFAQRFTARYLHFVPKAESSNPDRVWMTGEAHCVGYAALMGAVLEEVYRQKREELLLVPEVTQCRGNIYFFGWRLTGPDRPGFFRDHDYIHVNSVASSQAELYDPAVYDYLRIKRVQ